MKRDKHQFLKLYEPVHESFSRFCHARAYRVMEPEDLISESITQALENLDRLKSEKAFLSYMFSIAKNIVSNKYRRLKFSGIFSEKQAERVEDTSLDPATRLDIEVLYKALDQLSTKQKEALILFEISGFSIKEICEIQKSSLSAVKQRLKRGRESLAAYFASDQLQAEPAFKPSALLYSVFL